MCEIWHDHRFGNEHVIEAGTDPRRGAYVRVERTCVRCGRKTEETRWLSEGINRHLKFASWASLAAS